MKKRIAVYLVVLHLVVYHMDYKKLEIKYQVYLGSTVMLFYYVSMDKRSFQNILNFFVISRPHLLLKHHYYFFIKRKVPPPLQTTLRHDSTNKSVDKEGSIRAFGKSQLDQSVFKNLQKSALLDWEIGGKSYKTYTICTDQRLKLTILEEIFLSNLLLKFFLSNIRALQMNETYKRSLSWYYYLCHRVVFLL